MLTQTMKKDELKSCALSFNVQLVLDSALLLLQRCYTEFALSHDARTLLSTSQQTEIIQLPGGGEYHHFGVERAVRSILQNVTAEERKTIK